MSQIASEFFRTWGIGQIAADATVDFTNDAERAFLGINYIDYVPLVGMATGAVKTGMIVFGQIGGNLSTAAKIGAVAHGLIAACGLGFLCFPVDASLTLARKIRMMETPLSWKMVAQAVEDFFESWGFFAFGPALEYTDDVVSPLREREGKSSIRAQFTLINILSYIPLVGAAFCPLTWLIAADSNGVETRYLSLAGRVGIAARSVLVSAASTALLFSPIGGAILGTFLLVETVVSVAHAAVPFVKGFQEGLQGQRQEDTSIDQEATPVDQVD